MPNVTRWLLLLPLLLMPASPQAAAESPADLVAAEVAIPITHVGPLDAHRCDVFIRRGSADGVIVGWRGDIHAVRSGEGESERNADYLGSAEVVYAAEHVSRLAVTLTHPEGPTCVRVGDVVDLHIRIPDRGERSLLWQLVTKGIHFNGTEHAELYFDFDLLREGETTELVNSILDLMTERLRRSGRDYGYLEQLSEPLPSGRYKGRVPGVLLAETSRAELVDFLKFVLTYPGKYYGKTWKIDETFATWLINGAPYSAAELADKLSEAPTGEARRALLEEQREQAADALDLLYQRARAKHDRDEKTEADRLAQIAVESRASVDAPSLVLEELFTKAYLLAGVDNEASILAYDLAIAAYREAGNAGGEYACHHNRAGRMKALRRLPEALAGYLAAAALSERADRSWSTRGSTILQIGHVLYELARYPEAETRYAEAAACFESADERGSITDALSWRATTLVKLGRNEEGARVYEALRVEHRRLHDRAREISTVEKIGDQHWELGRYEAAAVSYAAVLAYARERGDEAEIARGLTNLARLAFNRGAFAEAVALHEQALSLLRKMEDRRGEAESLTDLAEVRSRLGEAAQAIAQIEQAIAIQTSFHNSSGAAYSHERLAAIHETNFDYERARISLDEAVRLARESGSGSLIARTLKKRSAMLLNLREFVPALADAREALARAEESQELGAQADIHQQMAGIFNMQGEIPRAMEAIHRTLGLAGEIGNRRIEAGALSYLGHLHTLRFEWEEARSVLAESIRIYSDPALADPESADTVRLSLAANASRRGESGLALELARAVASSARERGSPRLERSATLSVADLLASRGGLAEAHGIYQRVVSELEDDPWARAGVLLALGMVEQDLGRGELAVAHTEEALTLYRHVHNEWGEMDGLNGLAHLLRSQGDAARAQPLAHEAMGIAARANFKGALPMLHGTSGEIELDLGRTLEARAHFQQALAAARTQGVGRTIAETLLLVARAARREASEESLVLAADSLAESLLLFRAAGARHFEADVLDEQAQLQLDRGDPGAALTLAREALPIATAIGSPHLLWRTRYSISRALEMRGDAVGALTERREVIAILDTLRSGLGSDAVAQRAFLHSRIGVYESMAELLGRAIEDADSPETRQLLTNEALGFVGRSRFELLQEGVRGVEGTGSPTLDALLERMAGARRDAARLEREIEEARVKGNRDLAQALTKVLATTLESLAAMHDNLVADDPDFAARVKFNPAYLREVAVLPPKARLVLLFPGVKTLNLWVYSSEGIVAWKQHTISREALYGMVEEFRALIDEVVAKAGESKGRGFGPEAEANGKNPDWYRENCRRMRLVLTELHRHLIEPIAGEVAEADPLLLVPYGWLNYLPFEALLDGEGNFLGEKTRLSYFVHFDHLRDTLARLRGKAHEGADVWVAYADPVGKLKSAIEEAGEIGAFFPQHEIYTRATGTATEDQLFAIREDCTILHFATHGYLNGVQPASTFLELAAGATEDGKLMQREIWPRLQTRMGCIKNGNLRLVVLSACETARAANAPEAEVLGMPDKFCAVGSPAVVASLWSVYTWSTTNLMVEFYRQMTQEKEDLGSALLGARRALLVDKANGRYAHPYYWSPFLLFGDWR